jgi:hypothetical protein
LTYENDAGSEETKTYSFGVSLTQPPARLATSRIKTTPETLKQDEKATIEIRIENYGYGEARNVRTVLSLGNQSFSSIVGKIAGEDRGTANFFIPKFAFAGVVDTVLKISYEDSAGEHETETPIQFVSEQRVENASALPYVVIIVFLVLLFFNRHRVIRFLRGRKE